MEIGLTARSSRLIPKLQWGHDISVMEISSASRDVDILSTLQWGHDISVMEIRVLPQVLRVLLRFNGAMTFQSWKS